MNLFQKCVMTSGLVGLCAIAALYHATPAGAGGGLLMLGQGGQPSGAPRPTNPVAPPANSQPRPSSAPGATQPTPPTPTTPPAPTEDQPATATPVVVQPGTVPGSVIVVGARSDRPFTFASPGAEVRFVENSRRLAVQEQKMTKSNQDLLKRLGEVRSLPPERQNAALFELLQQMLMEQQQLHQYLTSSRSSLTGDLETTANTATPAAIPSPTAQTSTPPQPSNQQP